MGVNVEPRLLGRVPGGLRTLPLAYLVFLESSGGGLQIVLPHAMPPATRGA